MPGFYCQTFAWRAIMPVGLFNPELQRYVADHPMDSSRVRDAITGDLHGLFGMLFAMSTQAQRLDDYDVFFTPLNAVGVDFMRAFYAEMADVQSVLVRDLPCIYVGKFPMLGPLFNVDLSGDRMARPVYARDEGGLLVRVGSHPIPVYAPMERVHTDLPREHSRLLRAFALSGQMFPAAAEVAWYRVPILTMDALVHGNFFELYFFRDRGTGRGPCLALYATVRSFSRVGLCRYRKIELYGVPDNDPNLWWRHRDCYDLGHIELSWGTHPGEVRARI